MTPVEECPLPVVETRQVKDISVERHVNRVLNFLTQTCYLSSLADPAFLPWRAEPVGW